MKIENVKGDILNLYCRTKNKQVVCAIFKTLFTDKYEKCIMVDLNNFAGINKNVKQKGRDVYCDIGIFYVNA